jgi:hypothetical protein
MNLTSKQLFKFVAACACACAISATATDYVSDSFETTDSHPGVDGSFGLAIGEYKTTTYVVGADTFTNYVWYAAENDASTIISNDAAYADILGDGPITNTTAELVLELATEGNTLSRTAGVSVASSPAYVDTLIRFTPSEDDPEIDMTDVKVALYVNAESNLVVRHKMFGASVETNSVLSAINPEAWYRLTLEVKNLDGFGTYATRVLIDGVAVTHPNAYVEPFDAVTTGGEWFLNYQVGTGNDTVNLVSFQGTGLLDELVVSDEMPNFEVPEVIMLTLVGIGDGGATFTVGGSPVTEVETGTEVTIEATTDWYVISSVTGPIDQDVSGLLPASSIVTTLTATASCTVTADTAVVSTGSTGIGGGTYPLSLVAPWAIANSVPEGGLTEAMEDDYLLNVAPGTDAQIQIDSIEVSGTTVTIVVSTLNTLVDFDEINGTLKLYSATTVDGTYTEVGSASVGSGDDSVQIDITGVANPTDFFKAVVE